MHMANTVFVEENDHPTSEPLSTAMIISWSVFNKHQSLVNIDMFIGWWQGIKRFTVRGIVWDTRSYSCSKNWQICRRSPPIGSLSTHSLGSPAVLMGGNWCLFKPKTLKTHLNHSLFVLPTVLGPNLPSDGLKPGELIGDPSRTSRRAG